MAITSRTVTTGIWDLTIEHHPGCHDSHHGGRWVARAVVRSTDQTVMDGVSGDARTCRSNTLMSAINGVLDYATVIEDLRDQAPDLLALAAGEVTYPSLGI